MSEIRAEIEGRVLRLNNLDKVLYPRTGTTKGEVLDYYTRIAPVLLTQLRGRPVSRQRWPHGVGRPGFVEKNAPAGTPSWVRTVRVGDVVHPVVDDLPTLLWLANLAALELHVPQWRVDEDGAALGADRLVIDLDPGEPAGLGECCQVALLVREVLGATGVEVTPVASGSKGLHLYAAMPAPTDSETTSAIARTVAEQLEQSRPELVLSSMSKARRGGKVFLDWSQNNAAKTTIAPYSLRGRDRPTVAGPLTWDEVAAGAEDALALEQPLFADVLRRVEEHGDLFGAVET
jgi:bifunctional non-homologous end joining protein LigD